MTLENEEYTPVRRAVWNNNGKPSTGPITGNTGIVPTAVQPQPPAPVAQVSPVAQPVAAVKPGWNPTLGGPGPRPLDEVPGSGTKPPVQVPPGTAGAGSTPGATGQPPATPGSLGLDFMRQVTPNELVENRLNNLLSSDSRYIQNARLRGAEYAASRGNINSSIGAGASERAAIEAGMPIAESDAGVYRDANAGNFQVLNQLRQMRTAAELEDWMGSQSFNREFNGQLAMIPINSAADMLTYITQRALEDPAVYTPDVMSGFNNFFNLNMRDVLSSFFGGAGTPPGGG